MALDHEKISKFIKNDTRTPEEIFAALCNRLRELCIERGEPVPLDHEIEEGARRLIGYGELLMGIR